jgi:hypothetical protein
MERAAAGQDLEILARAAQQDQRGGIARPHDRVAQVDAGRGGVVHGDHYARFRGVGSSRVNPSRPPRQLQSDLSRSCSADLIP